MAKLITARAKLLKRAIDEGIAKSGNHEILVEGDLVTFKFHGTPITVWNKKTGVVTQDAHGFATVSTTSNQQKNARAVKEYRGAL